jgi:DivIVA domain-containing protein
VTESYGDLVEEITMARFTPTRIREGYDMAEVDELLDRVVAALGRGEPVAGLIAEARFSVVTWREGYHKAEVDDFLARLRGRAG